MKIFLIRHTSVAVPKGVCYGATDVALSDTFIQEASAVRDKLLPQGPFDAVYSSHLGRAISLARFCGYEPDTDRRLAEMDFGEWEMKRYDEIDDPQLQRYYDDYLHERATGGESFQDQRQRVGEFLDEVMGKYPSDASIAIFCHGGTIVCALLHLGLVTESDAFSDLLSYGGIRMVEI